MTARVVNIPRQSLYLLVTWVVLLVFGTIMVGSASVSMPGDYIITFGTVSHNMYFVQEGKVTLRSLD